MWGFPHLWHLCQGDHHWEYQGTPQSWSQEEVSRPPGKDVFHRLVEVERHCGSDTCSAHNRHGESPVLITKLWKGAQNSAFSTTCRETASRCVGIRSTVVGHAHTPVGISRFCRFVRSVLAPTLPFLFRPLFSLLRRGVLRLWFWNSGFGKRHCTSVCSVALPGLIFMTFHVSFSPSFGQWWPWWRV